MKIEKKIISKAKKNFSMIVLPEAEKCDRVREAGIKAAKKNVAKIIFIGGEELKQYENNNIRVINPSKFENKDVLINILVEKRKHKGMTPEQAKEELKNPLMFATMLVECGFADGMVAGAITKTSDVLRPPLQVIKGAEGVQTISSAFLMCGKTIKNKEKCLVFSDCGLNVDPTSEQLAEIAIETAKSAEKICDMKPVVAFLSFTTLGSADPTPDIDKIKETMQILKTKKVDFAFDGEFQVDAALSPEVAEIKAPNSEVAGKANCLIFPNIMAGNIGYKLFQRGGEGYVKAIGPFMQGLRKPVNDLSRGATVDEIVLSIALTAIQAENRKK